MIFVPFAHSQGKFRPTWRYRYLSVGFPGAAWLLTKQRIDSLSPISRRWVEAMQAAMTDALGQIRDLPLRCLNPFPGAAASQKLASASIRWLNGTLSE